MMNIEKFSNEKKIEKAVIDGKNITVKVWGQEGKGKKALEIVKNVSFSAVNKEFIGICGPNGAGKSTLLKALSGLVKSDGDIYVNDRPLNSYRRNHLAKIFSYMHQDTLMPFAFTVENVVALGRFPYLGYFAEIGKSDREIIHNSMDIAGCYDYKDKYVTQLSGGERQRVMLARVLAQDTPMIFLDEPTSSQDIRHAQETLELLRKLADEGRTIITVLHDLRLAAKYCTKTALMYEGRIVASGDPEDVFHQGHLEYVFHIRTATFTNPGGDWDFYTIL